MSDCKNLATIQLGMQSNFDYDEDSAINKKTFFIKSENLESCVFKCDVNENTFSWSARDNDGNFINGIEEYVQFPLAVVKVETDDFSFV